MAVGQLALTPHEHRATAGDDWRLGVTLWSNGAAADVHLCTINAALRDANGYLVVASIAQSSGTTGASWASGVVVVAFPASATGALLRDCEYYLEIQVTDGSGLKTTWPWIPVLVHVSGL